MTQRVGLVLVLVTALAAVAVTGTLAATLDDGPQDVFGAKEQQALLALVASAQADNGSYDNGSLSATHYAVALQKRQGVSVSRQTELCAWAGAQVPTTAKDAWHWVAVHRGAACTYSLSAVGPLIDAGLASRRAADIYYAASANAMWADAPTSDAAVAGAVAALLDLHDSIDGGFAAAPGEEVEAAATGMAMSALATLAKNAGSKVDAQAGSKVMNKVRGFVRSHAVKNDEWLAFASPSTTSYLGATSAVLRGVAALSTALDAKLPLTAEQMSMLAQFFLTHRSVGSVEQAYHLYMGLHTIASNKFFAPVVVYLVDGTVQMGRQAGNEVIIRAVDVFDRPLRSPVRVYLSRAGPLASPTTTVLSNQELNGVADAPGSFSINFLAAKPDAGFYQLDLRVTSDDATLATPEHALRVLKVLTSVDVSDAEVAVVSSSGVVQRSGVAAAVGDKLDTKLAADAAQGHVLRVAFKLRNTANKKVFRAHQTMVQLRNGKTDTEATFMAQYRDKRFSVDIDLAVHGMDMFSGVNGTYAVRVLVGDAAVTQGVSWHVADVALKFPASLYLPPFDADLRPLPEIAHQFRASEKRAATPISTAFTAAVLAPGALLLVSLLGLGINFGNFPSGVDGLAALGMHACIGGLIVLFGVYWLRLDMFTTLSYAAPLLAGSVFFGAAALRGVSQKRKH